VRAGERHPPARPEGVATSSMPMDASARSITGPFSWLLSRLCRSFGSIAVSALSWFQLCPGFGSVSAMPASRDAVPQPGPRKIGDPRGGPGTASGTPTSHRSRQQPGSRIRARVPGPNRPAWDLPAVGSPCGGISLRWDRPAWDRPSSDLPSNPTPHPVIAPRSRPRGSPPVSDRRRVVARSARIGNRPRPVVRFRRRLPTVATCHRPRSRASRR
jgi:hypothetical protein